MSINDERRAELINKIAGIAITFDAQHNPFDRIGVADARDILAMIKEQPIGNPDELPWKVSEGDGQAVAAFATKSYAEAFCGEMFDRHPSRKPPTITGPDDDAPKTSANAPSEGTPAITFKPYEPPSQSVEDIAGGNIVAGLHIDYALCDEQQPIAMVNRGGVAYVRSASEMYDVPIGPSHNYRVIPPRPETLADVPVGCWCLDNLGRACFTAPGHDEPFKLFDNGFSNTRTPAADIKITRVLGFPQLIAQHNEQ